MDLLAQVLEGIVIALVITTLPGLAVLVLVDACYYQPFRNRLKKFSKELRCGHHWHFVQLTERTTYRCKHLESVYDEMKCCKCGKVKYKDPSN